MSRAKKGKGNTRRRRERGWQTAMFEPVRYRQRPFTRPAWDADLDWPLRPERVGPPPPIDYNWVTDRIATGGGIWTAADVDRLAADGVTHVVTAAEELTSTTAALLEGRMAHLANGVLDDFKWKPVVWFGTTVEWVTEALRDPSAKVYIHCWAGKNRGPSSAYAALRATGHSKVAAERLIRSARPQVRLLYRPDADTALARMGIR